MLNPGGSLHGACAAYLIDMYVFHLFHPLLLSFQQFFSGFTNRVCSCTTLVFLAASRGPGVSASMDVVYHAPAAL